MTALLSAGGKLHRPQANGRLHPRCAGGSSLARPVEISNEAAARYATGRPAVLCRYRWCFRDVLIAAGIDPWVGHLKRVVRAPTPAEIEELVA